MSTVRALDSEKLRTRRIIATAVLTAVVVVGLLYRGGVAFVSSLSDATASASRSVDRPGTVAATTTQGETPTRPDGAPGVDPRTASAPPPPGSSPAAATGPEDSSPGATEQRMFKSRRALETIDPREFVRQAR